MKRVNLMFTIDPLRDTIKVLNDYASVSHERLVALTGSVEQISVASKVYRTYYRKNGTGEDYLMDHSTFSYLMDETGFLQFFRRDVSPDEVAKTISCFSNV